MAAKAAGKASVTAIPTISLANFDESDAKCVLNSPRSLQACKSEGVLPAELMYKPPEAFQERSLSPRLVKLRYDFFEAKRRDLLAAAKRARDAILADEKREKGEEQTQLDILSKETGYSKGAILALNGDTLAYERRKLLKAQEVERKWLENALANELHSLKQLEQNNLAAIEEGNQEAEKQREAARKLKELNDKRAADEERKQMEAEARMKLEKQIAKEEFARQQEEIKRKGELEALKQKEAYERQKAEAQRKIEAEMEKERKREEAAREQQARKDELRAQDLRRQETMDAQKATYQQAMREKQDARDLRIYKSIQANMEMEQKRRDEFDEKCRLEAIRDEKRAQQDALRQEEAAKKSFQLMMRRKVIQEESIRKSEERRSAILEQQEDTEMRLLEHEQKKERYLDFKRELDGLRGKNKEINVERQRRKEEAKRESIAEDVRKKDEKIDCMRSERQRLWQIRMSAQMEAHRARELVKSEIIRQRVRSKFDSKVLAHKVTTLMNQDVFHPKVVQTSHSMPTLKRGIECEPVPAS